VPTLTAGANRARPFSQKRGVFCGVPANHASHPVLGNRSTCAMQAPGQLQANCLDHGEVSACYGRSAVAGNNLLGCIKSDSCDMLVRSITAAADVRPCGADS
jgi:hypothetical protein